MIPIPGRKALRNPILRGALDAMTQRGTAWTHGLNYAAVLSLALFITWPKEGFLSLRDLPFTYNAMGGTATIILAYLNFTQGARNLLGAQDATLRDWLAFTPLPIGTFLRGYLAAGSVETLFFWGLSWPLLLLAAGVSGESLAHLGTGMLVLLACLTAYRIIGVTLADLVRARRLRPLHPGARRLPVVHPRQRLRMAAQQSSAGVHRHQHLAAAPARRQSSASGP